MTQILEIREGSLAEFKFPANRVGQVIELDGLVRREIPQIVEVARFVARRISQGNDLLDDDFLE